MTTPTITVDLAKACVECRKPGAVESGICLTCTAEALSDRPMRSAIGRAVQARLHAFMGERKVP